MTAWDPKWDEVFGRQEWGKYPSEHVIRFVARNWYKAPDRKKIRLLDLGCGPGAHTWSMAREGFSVACIEGSARAIAQLRERLKGEGLQVESVAGDYLALPWGDEVFDGVLDSVSLCHNRFEDSKTAVHEVHRVLKPGGLFFSSSFTDRCWGFGTGAEVEPGGFSSVSEGPCAGVGFCRFMNQSRLKDLYGSFAELSIESCSWTLEARSKLIEMWLVTCRK